MILSVVQQLEAGLAGFAGGLLSGFFGVGGNVVLVPLLALTLGLQQQQAQGLTLAALLPPLGAPAVWQYHRSGVPILWPMVGFAIIGFLPGIPLGSALANSLPATTLRALFSALLVVVAWRTWNSHASEAQRPNLSAPPARYQVPSLIAGFASGVASGLLGIGGAIVLIPLLKRQGVNQKQAQAISLAMLLPPIALPGVWVYAQSQDGLPWAALLPVALGFVGGAFAGAKLNYLVNAARLTKAFAGILVVSALALVVSAFRS